MNLECLECTHLVSEHGRLGCGSCHCNLTDNGAFARAMKRRQDDERATRLDDLRGRPGEQEGNMTATDDDLEQRVADAIGHFFGGNGGVALTRREAARAVLAITESDKAEAVARARSVALNDAAGALSVLSSGTPTHIERETAKGVLRRLADETVTTAYALGE